MGTNSREAQLSIDSIVNFSKEQNELSGFEIDAYTGQVIERSWGKLAVGVVGMSAKQQMPIFLNHDRAAIVGHSTSFSKEKTFKVKGIFSKATQAAKEVKLLAGEGFPWQASIGVRPLTIVEIGQGSSMLVNGQDVSGPAEVWIESEVFETSFVTLGADSATSVAVFQDADNDQKKSIGEAMLQQNEWNRMTKQERSEFANDLEVFLAYHQQMPGVTVRECSRIEAGGGDTVSIESLKAEWLTNKNLQDEFAGEFELYAAYKTPMKGIRVKMTGRGIQR